MEIDFAIVDNIRGHAGKGYLQVFREVERVGIARTKLSEEFRKVLALDKTSIAGFVLAEGKSRREDVSLLLASVGKALVAKVFLVGNDVSPVLFPDHRVK